MNISDEELLDMLNYGNSVDQIEQVLSGGDTIKEDVSNNGICQKCDGEIIIIDGFQRTCKECGCINGSTFVNEWVEEIWMKVKSKHKISRWMRNKLVNVSDPKYYDAIIGDFTKIVSVMRRLDLIIGKNISRYSFYIIRIASRRGIKLIGIVKDMVDGRTKESFEDRLFGQVYPALGWNTGCKCPYYAKWKDRQKDGNGAIWS